MNLSAATKNCWLQGILFLGIVALLSALALFYWGAAWGCLVLLIFGFTVFNWLEDIRQKVCLSMGDELRTFAAEPREFDWLDLERLEQYSNQFTDLGFVKITDYKLDEEYPPKGIGFARLFAHPEYFCFAEISQLLGLDKKPISMEYYIGSSFEKNWELTTTTRPLLGISFVWRNPKKLWTYHPNTSPSELWQYHLQLREKMITDLQIEVYPEISWDFYCERVNKSFIERNQIWARKNLILGLIEVTLFEIKSPPQWLGDYQNFTKRK